MTEPERAFTPEELAAERARVALEWQLPVQRDGESTGRLATLRADLKAAGWTAQTVRLSDEDRAEMIRDYGIEGA